MSWKSILISSLFFFLALNTFGRNSGSGIIKEESLRTYQYKPVNITYSRVFHDGIWWIVVYMDGVKIDEYPDPDQ